MMIKPSSQNVKRKVLSCKSQAPGFRPQASNWSLQLAACHASRNVNILHLFPVRPAFDVDLEWHLQVGVGALHLLADELDNLVDLGVRHLEDQFIVNLEQHTGRQLAAA